MPKNKSKKKDRKEEKPHESLEYVAIKKALRKLRKLYL
jgi:hypothetical protein